MASGNTFKNAAGVKIASEKIKLLRAIHLKTLRALKLLRGNKVVSDGRVIILLCVFTRHCGWIATGRAAFVRWMTIF